MGKGGSAPSAPDMSQNISNANSTYNTATSDAGQTMSTAQAYNQNAQNTLANSVNAETPMMNSVNSTAQQNLSNYASTFQPLQQQEAQEAQNYTSTANQQAQEGAAMAGVNSAANAQRQASQQALASEGVDPASIHGAALDAQSRATQAASAAQAGTQAYQNNIQTGFNMTNSANQLGMQVNDAGNSGATTGSNIANSNVSNTNSTNSTGVNNLTAANTYLDSATSANSSAANIANQQYSDQMQQYQANQASANSTLSSIGSIAGAAAMFMQTGGPVPAQGIPQPMSTGGLVHSQGALSQSPIPGSTDTKPAFLTPGEFVIPKDVSDYRGHAYWYNQIDKARAEISARHGIPPQAGAAHTARGH